MAIALQTIMLAYPMRYLACFVTLALGSYLNSITLAEGLASDIKSLDADRKKMLRPRILMVKKVSKLINLHSFSKQLSRAANILYNSSRTK